MTRIEEIKNRAEKEIEPAQLDQLMCDLWSDARRPNRPTGGGNHPLKHNRHALAIKSMLESSRSDARHLLSKVEAAETELLEWKKALHSLTAGGSEFANDRKACVDYIRNRFSTGHELIIKSVKARQAAEAKVEAAENTIRLLADDLEVYGHHLACLVNDSAVAECTCGFDEALGRVAAYRKTTGE